MSLIVTWVAKRGGFYRLPTKKPPYPLPFWQTIGIFAVFLSISYLLLPLLTFALAYFKTGSITAVMSFSKVWLGWIQIAAFFILLVALLLYCKCLKKENTLEIFWGGKRKHYLSTALRDIGFGAMTWLVSYPIVVLISLLAGFISLQLWGVRGIEQLAVKQLLKFLDKPVLFVFLALSVVLLVPFMEELLFRGFFQTWLKRYMNRGWAIVITSLLFSLVHFAPSQKFGNFELILSLFVLSSYLGFIYERQRTIWAPVGLHLTFNGITIIGILFTQ